ncbi:MAG: TonB-dependent receptor [Calditrichaeota bacterium]|nr:TonB-dependent receptor [Calditrichota bacterium]
MNSKAFNYKHVLLMLAVSMFFSTILFAGVTGKVSGVVKDKDTGEVLPGANVVVEGTNRGAAADANGNYLILNLPPGEYSLKVQMIGYQPTRITGVQVYTDRTTKVNCELSMTVIEGQEVTIVAGREPVEFDRTNTASYVNSKEMDALPVSNLSQVIQMQAGVVTGSGGALHFRGGRSREVAYMIDGIPVSNSFSQGGGSNVTVETNFVKELQVITGTFNAEYGAAQSGIINIVTKVPENKFDGTAEVWTGGYYAPRKPMYIGLDSYNPVTDKEIKFSISGPLPFPKKLGKLGFFLNGRLVNNNGFLNGQRRFMPTDGWEIKVYREWYRAIYDPEDNFVIPLPDSLHTGDGKIVPMNWGKRYNYNLKLVYQPFNAITLSYNFFHNNGHSKSFSSSWRFCPGGTPEGWSSAVTHMLTMTSVLAENIFFNLRYSYQTNSNKSYKYKSAKDPRYQTTAINAWDPGQITGFDFGGISSWNRSWFDQKTHLVNGDITWQINHVVELKAGFEGKLHDYHYKSAPMREVFGFEEMQFPYTRAEIEQYNFQYEFFKDTTSNYLYSHKRLRESSPDSLRDQQFFVEYDRQPRDGSAYAQTKLEMGELILNAGLRADFYWPRDRYAPDYSIVPPELVGNAMFYVPAKMKWQLSPRFGLSFPISDRGALRLSYGHFFQMPSYQKMYQNPVLENYNQYSIADSRIGNPNLKAERTVQYEVGLQQQLTSDISFESSVYYKDIRDLLGIEILTLSNAATFYRYVNKEYANSMGFTIAFNQGLAGGILSSRVDYTYMIAKGSASNAETLRDISVIAGHGKGAYNLAIRKINYLNWDQTHTLNASVTIHPTPTWNIAAIGQIGSGLPFTPATLDPSIDLPGGEWDNKGRKPVRWQLDLLLSKSFKFVGYKWTAMIKAFNVFDHLNENRVNSITGQAGPAAYLPEVARKRYSRLAQVGEFTRDEADYNPTWYSRPRFIQFGLQVGF